MAKMIKNKSLRKGGKGEGNFTIFKYVRVFTTKNAAVFSAHRGPSGF